MADQFIRITFTQVDGRRKMRFRQRDLRDVVLLTKRPIGELMGDPFGGWPYLLQHGLRSYDPTLTLDQASDLMDQWIHESDPEGDKTRTLDELGQKLLDALNASGFVRIDLKRKDAEQLDGEPAGNARQEAVPTLT